MTSRASAEARIQQELTGQGTVFDGVPFASDPYAMEPTVRDAVEEARAALAAFRFSLVDDKDCVPAARAAITHLHRTLSSALGGKEVALTDRRAVTAALLELAALGPRCGERTRALILEVTNLLRPLAGAG